MLENLKKISNKNIFSKVALKVIELMGDLYPELKEKSSIITSVLNIEFEKIISLIKCLKNTIHAMFCMNLEGYGRKKTIFISIFLLRE